MVSETDLDKLGNKMAQLVDGKARAILHEFEELLHASSSDIHDHPDWAALSADDKHFSYNLLATLTIQNACAFERRIITTMTDSFPIALLSLARVRPELPCEERKGMADRFLKLAAQSRLDVESMKILQHFRPAFETCKRSGKLDGRNGLELYIALKALRRTFIADVRLNEQLNKQLKLCGDRAPNASLELVSARAHVKHALGTVGARAEGLNIKSKKWSQLRPLAGIVLDKCLEHWTDGLKVMENIQRFVAPSAPDWCPCQQEVNQWASKLNVGLQKTSTSHVLAAVVSKKIYEFFKEKPKSGSCIVQPHFAALSFARQKLEQHRPYRLPEGRPIFLFAEQVNRSTRLLRGVWESAGQVKITRPWSFEWAADAVYTELDGQPGPLTVIAFPLSWVPVSDSGRVGMHPCLMRSGRQFVTIVEWQEDLWLHFIKK